MKEKIDPYEALAEFLLESLREGKGFVIEQAPDLALEIITVGRVQYTLGAVVLLTMTILLGRWCCWLGRKGEMEENDYTLGAIFSGMGSLGTAIGLIPTTYWMLVSWFAPKLFVISSVASWLGRK